MLGGAETIGDGSTGIVEAETLTAAGSTRRYIVVATGVTAITASATTSTAYRTLGRAARSVSQASAAAIATNAPCHVK